MRFVDQVSRLLGSPRAGRVWGAVAAWAALSAVMLVEVAGMVDPRQWGVALVSAVLLASAFVVARRSPTGALVLVGAVALAQVLVSVVIFQSAWAMSYLLPVIVFAFLAGRRSARLLPIAGIVVGAAAVSGSVITAQWLARPGRSGEAISAFADWSSVVIVAIMVVIAPWLLGGFWRDHSAIGVRGWEAAERLDRVRASETEHARLRERARIASEMHDSLGHSLTLVGVRAAALEMAAGEDAEQRVAASELRAAAHEATLRLREIIGVLRREHQTEEVSVDDIATLVHTAQAADLRVRLTREGLDPPPTTQVGAAACRVVREALTNAAKYAPQAEITVTVVRDEESTTVLVVDDGPGAADVGGGPGTGLAGLRERVQELRGTLDAGAAEEGIGFRVRAWLPEPSADVSSGTHRTRLAQERENVTRNARRGLVTAVLVPVVLAAAIAGLTFALLWFRGVNSVLDPADYADLTTGDTRATVEEVLPLFALRPRELVDESSPPGGSTCEFYSSSREAGLPTIYRLCFAEGRLVAKDEFQQQP